MAYSLVQSNHNTGLNVGSTGLAFPGAVTAGNLLVLTVSYDSGKTITAVSGGGTWARVGTSQLDSTNGQRSETWYCANATGGATTATWSVGGGGINFFGVVIEEWSGVTTTTPLDVSDTTKAFGVTTTSANAETSNSVTPTTGDLLLAFYSQSQPATTISAGTGFTIGTVEVGSGSGAVGTENKTAGAGPQNATFTVGHAGDNYTVQIAAFKAAAGGGTDASVTHVIGNVTLGGVAPTLTKTASVTHVIGNVTLGASAPVLNVGSVVTHVIGNLVLGAAAPTVTGTGSASVTHVIGSVTLSASAPTLTSLSTVTHVIGELVLQGGNHTITNGSASTRVNFVSSPAPAILYLINQEGPLA